jgi:hypothetical protein
VELDRPRATRTCCSGCAKTHAAPAPRKAAPKATAAPARWCWANSTRRRHWRSSPSTPASSSCPRWTARPCSRWKTCRAHGRPLHPVQQSLVDCHGSQCGFCTPGFVMSLWASYQQHQAAGTLPSRQDLADDFSGNLCRCTGYRPILDAGQRMFEAPPAPLDTGPRGRRAARAAGRSPAAPRWFPRPAHAGRLCRVRLALPQARCWPAAPTSGCG